MSKRSEERRRVHAMGLAEAQQELKAKRRHLFELRLQLTRGEVKNNRQFAQTKKDIARLMFHIGELDRLEWAGEEVAPEAVADEEIEAESAASTAEAAHEPEESEQA